MQLCFFVEFKFQAFCGKGISARPWSRELCSLGSLQGASWSVPQTEHLNFHSSSVRHCKASWTSGIVIGREKSRMDVDVSPAGRSRQLWGLLMSHIMIVYSTPGKFSSGIQAIKRVVKLQQKLLAKSNVPGWRRSQVGTSRTGSNQL